MKMRYFIIMLLSFSTLLGSCYEDYFEEEGPKWGGEGTPAWLKEKTMLLYYDEIEPMFSSYLANFSYQVYKVKYNDSYYIAIQYVSFNGKEVKRNIQFFSDTGKKTGAEGLKKAFESSKQLIKTNKVGGKDGYVPQIKDFIIDKNNITGWVQTEFDRICEQVNGANETILYLAVEAFKYQSETYVAIHKISITSTTTTQSDSKKLLYTEDSKPIDETSELYKEISLFESSNKIIILSWGLYVSI